MGEAEGIIACATRVKIFRPYPFFCTIKATVTRQTKFLNERSLLDCYLFTL